MCDRDENNVDFYSRKKLENPWDKNTEILKIEVLKINDKYLVKQRQNCAMLSLICKIYM